jgi:hypothetical protein
LFQSNVPDKNSGLTDGRSNIWGLSAFSFIFMWHFPYKTSKINTLTSRFLGFPSFLTKIMDGMKLGRTDKAATICSSFRKHENKQANKKGNVAQM